jgi:hypothetical protein
MKQGVMSLSDQSERGNSERQPIREPENVDRLPLDPRPKANLDTLGANVHFQHHLAVRGKINGQFGDRAPTDEAKLRRKPFAGTRIRWPSASKVRPRHF